MKSENWLARLFVMSQMAAAASPQERGWHCSEGMGEAEGGSGCRLAAEGGVWVPVTPFEVMYKNKRPGHYGQTFCWVLPMRAEGIIVCFLRRTL